MLEKMRIFVAAIGPDITVITAMAQGFSSEIQSRNDLVRGKLKSAVATVKRICVGEEDRDEGLSLIAGVIGCEVRELL